MLTVRFPAPCDFVPCDVSSKRLPVQLGKDRSGEVFRQVLDRALLQFQRAGRDQWVRRTKYHHSEVNFLRVWQC